MIIFAHWMNRKLYLEEQFMKKIIVWLGIIIAIVIIVIVVTWIIKKETMNYSEFVDEKCGFEISRFLEYDKGSFGVSEEHFSLQFKVKKGCEMELENVLNDKYSDLIKMDDTVRIDSGSMYKFIQTGNKRHIYTFFRSGKNKKTVEINICIVDINGQQYAFIYTI